MSLRQTQNDGSAVLLGDQTSEFLPAFLQRRRILLAHRWILLHHRYKGWLKTRSATQLEEAGVMVGVFVGGEREMSERNFYDIPLVSKWEAAQANCFSFVSLAGSGTHTWPRVSLFVA